MTPRSLTARCRKASNQAGHSLAECALIFSFVSAMAVAVTSVLGPQLHAFGGAVIYTFRFTWHSL